MTNIPIREAAELCGMTRSAFVRAMHRLRARGTDLRAPETEWPDARTPLYDSARLTAWLESRETPPA